MLSLLAVTPLIVTKSLFFPYVSGKVFFIHFIVSFVFILLAISIIKSKQIREGIVLKLKEISSQWVFILTSLFIFFVGLSVLFAPDMYRAFFGDLERGEGFLGILFFYLFFVLTLLLFERKHWLRFSQLTLASGFILFIDQAGEYFTGVIRPASYTGNPIYLATVFLFVLFAALFVFNEYKEKKGSHVGFRFFWMFVSILMSIFSLIGIFLTETRGMIVGIFISLLVLLVYLYFKGREVYIKNISLRKIIGIIAVCFLFFVVGFFVTKDNVLWQGVPGLDRISQLTFDNGTVQTRLISIGVSFEAINLIENGWDTFLFGWGQENFSVAYNSHYNSEYLVYENKWFDRAHNKLLDVLVMQGLLGFLAYIGMWGVAFWQLFKQKLSLLNASLIFFGVAYFIQNLFVFDSVVTYIPFFSFIALSLTPSLHERRIESQSVGVLLKKVPSSLFVLKVSALTLFIVFAFISWRIIPFSQIKGYIYFMAQNPDANALSEHIDTYLTPYTYAQDVIRTHLVGYTSDLYKGKESEKEVLLQSIQSLEDVIEREPLNPRRYIKVGEAYEVLGRKGLVEYYDDAENAFREASYLAPNRQDVLYALAFNLGKQDRFDEAVSVAQETISLEDKVASSHFVLGSLYVADGQFEKGFEKVEDAFELNKEQTKLFSGSDAVVFNLLQYYYLKKDVEKTLMATDWLEYIRPDKKEGLDVIRGFVNSGEWKEIQFEG